MVKKESKSSNEDFLPVNITLFVLENDDDAYGFCMFLFSLALSNLFCLVPRDDDDVADVTNVGRFDQNTFSETKRRMPDHHATVAPHAQESLQRAARRPKLV